MFFICCLKEWKEKTENRSTRKHPEVSITDKQKIEASSELPRFGEGKKVSRNLESEQFLLYFSSLIFSSCACLTIEERTQTPTFGAEFSSGMRCVYGPVNFLFAVDVKHSSVGDEDKSDQLSPLQIVFFYPTLLERMNWNRCRRVVLIKSNCGRNSFIFQ